MQTLSQESELVQSQLPEKYALISEPNVTWKIYGQIIVIVYTKNCIHYLFNFYRLIIISSSGSGSSSSSSKRRKK